MATYIQRLQSACDALLNAVATQAQMNRLARAIAWQTGRLSEYDAGTNAQKAAIGIAGMRAWAINTVKSFEAQAAANTAAASAVATTDADYAEAP